MLDISTSSYSICGAGRPNSLGPGRLIGVINVNVLELTNTNESAANLACSLIYLEGSNTRLRERLHELFSTLNLGDFLHMGPKLELKRATLLARVDAPLSRVHMEEKNCQTTWFSGKQSRFGMQICRNQGLFKLMCTEP